MKEDLGEILVNRGKLSATRLEEFRKRVGTSRTRLVGELLKAGLEEREIFNAVARSQGAALGNVDDLLEILDRNLVKRVPRTYLEHEGMLPLRLQGHMLDVAISSPDAPLDDLCLALSAGDSRVHVVTPTDMRRIWSILDLAPVDTEKRAANKEDEMLGDANFESRMVALFEAILLDAIGSRASDIHFERYEDDVRLRMRVDGHLHDIRRFPISTADLRGIVNVVKIASNIDITERRLPQGGRFRRRAGDDVFDLRVQTQPSLHGEHLVIRLLPQKKEVLRVEDLGFEDDAADQYHRLLESPQGMVLVVGPTGSGKSTTLYAGLQKLALDTSRKVITVEDPIEYAIRGVQQTQVHPEIGFAFANAMRAFVREDPDVILVGEIRDGETALEAIRASQTGHLVLSTLHCNDTVDAVQRLVDLGMHPNSIASELIAVISQRLVRRICPDCKVEDEPDSQILAELFVDRPPEHFRCFKGAGCDRCDGRGTRGRIATFEFLRVGESIRRGIAHHLTVDELRHLARDAGLKPIRNHLIELVLRGVTPLSEVPRTLSIEQMAPH